MKGYLTKILDWHTNAVTNQYDELPYWSSPFGTLLLDNFPIGNYKQYVDIGCGTGFPLIDISQRLGNECESYGIDPWHAAMDRAHEKIKTIGLGNIELIETDASSLPFDDNSTDLITSNLGINNFESPLPVIEECFRILKKGSSFCTTSNLNGTFNEFYEIFEMTLKELDLYEKYETEFTVHVNHRGTIKSMQEMFETSGFEIIKRIDSETSLRYLNGTAFLNHSVIIVGFIDPWRNLLDEQDKGKFFDKLEENLNVYSEDNGELKLTIPIVYFECKK